MENAMQRRSWCALSNLLPILPLLATVHRGCLEEAPADQSAHTQTVSPSSPRPQVVQLDAIEGNSTLIAICYRPKSKSVSYIFTPALLHRRHPHRTLGEPEGGCRYQTSLCLHGHDPYSIEPPSTRSDTLTSGRTSDKRAPKPPNPA